MKAAIAFAAALAVATPASAQPVDARMDRVLAERRTPFAAKMDILRQRAGEALREASLAAQVCDKERLRRLHAELLRLKAEMEAEQSSWLPPYSSQFDPNLWGYVHNQLIHAVEQVAAWLRIDCVFPNVPLGPRGGGSGQPGVIDDIDWWNRTNHEQWFETAEALRLKGDCARWRALLDRIESELRRQLRNPTGPADKLPERIARLQRLWRHLMADVRLRHCPPMGTGTTPEQQLIERRRSEGDGRARTPLPPIDQVPHRNSSGQPVERHGTSRQARPARRDPSVRKPSASATSRNSTRSPSGRRKISSGPRGNGVRSRKRSTLTCRRTSQSRAGCWNGGDAPQPITPSGNVCLRRRSG